MFGFFLDRCSLRLCCSFPLSYKERSDLRGFFFSLFSEVLFLYCGTFFLLFPRFIDFLDRAYGPVAAVRRGVFPPPYYSLRLLSSFLNRPLMDCSLCPFFFLMTFVSWSDCTGPVGKRVLRFPFYPHNRLLQLQSQIC